MFNTPMASIKQRFNIGDRKSLLLAVRIFNLRVKAIPHSPSIVPHPIIASLLLFIFEVIKVKTACRDNDRPY
jgi:hypothetical protein